MTKETKTKETKTKKKASTTLKVPTTSTYGTGRRKSAIAKVWLFEGSGKFQINKKDPKDYLKSDVLIETVTKPLRQLGLDKKYDIVISVIGGGIVGQADASSLGVARALLQLNENFRQPLREAGLVTRDARVKERKKYGRKKARKGYQFRKR